MLIFDKNGIYCPQADVYIDPWRKVPKALITHAHSDHAKWGCGSYLSHHLSVPVLKLRLGKDINVSGIAYNETIIINGVKISFHPAGHIIGSAQIRLEYKGEIWVVSGDYKLQNDGLSTPFEPVKCHHFITESTFGMPIYKFPNPETVHQNINNWWKQNQQKGLNSLIVGYSLGKAQRIIQHLDGNIGKIYTHGAVANINDAFENAGIVLKKTIKVTAENSKTDFEGSIIVAPPSAVNTPWLNKMKPLSIGICSGWMQLRGSRRRMNADMGFVLSDHCDWDQLNTAVLATEAENIYVTHGYKNTYARWLTENYGLNAVTVDTLYSDNSEEIETTQNIAEINE